MLYAKTNVISGKYHLMTTDPIKVSSEEIEQLRSQLANNSEAIAALDVIQECDGYLEDAVTLLAMRETGKEPDKSINLDKLAEKCRNVICGDKKEDVLELFNVIAPFFPPPTSLALPVVLYVVKIGVKKFCKTA